MYSSDLNLFSLDKSSEISPQVINYEKCLLSFYWALYSDIKFYYSTNCHYAHIW